LIIIVTNAGKPLFSLAKVKNPCFRKAMNIPSRKWIYSLVSSLPVAVENVLQIEDKHIFLIIPISH
jgi:hypothetical protein